LKQICASLNNSKATNRLIHRKLAET